MERGWNDDRLEDEGDRRGHEEMRCMLNESLPGDRQSENECMEREDVEKRIHPVLVEQEKAYKHQPASKQMGNIEGQIAHSKGSG